MPELLGIAPELYLQICDLLDAPDLARLTETSRAAYRATQKSLYSHVSVSSYDRLAKLTRTAMRFPVVSHPSTRQNRPRYARDESELIGHKISSLDIAVQKPRPGEKRYSIYHVSQLINSIVRSSPQVKISLTLWETQMFFDLGVKDPISPNVQTLTLIHPNKGSMYCNEYWTFLLSGEIFPGLQTLKTDGFTSRSQDSLHDRYFAMSDGPLPVRENLIEKLDIAASRLPYLQSLKIEGDIMLNQTLLKAFLDPKTTPKRLTTLSISFCPNQDKEGAPRAFSSVLKHALTKMPRLESLRMYIPACSVDRLAEEDEWEAVSNDPELHLCDIVRNFGQQIKLLELGIPFACSCMFARHETADVNNPAPTLDLSTFSSLPLQTLPARLVEKGFKHRRIIIWRGHCSEEEEFPHIVPYLETQGPEYSWEVVSYPERQGFYRRGEDDVISFGVDEFFAQKF